MPRRCPARVDRPTALTRTPSSADAPNPSRPGRASRRRSSGAIRGRRNAKAITNQMLGLRARRERDTLATGMPGMTRRRVRLRVSSAKGGCPLLLSLKGAVRRDRSFSSKQRRDQPALRLLLAQRMRDALRGCSRPSSRAVERGSVWLLGGDADGVPDRVGLFEHLEHEVGDVGSRDEQAAAEVLPEGGPVAAA